MPPTPKKKPAPKRATAAVPAPPEEAPGEVLGDRAQELIAQGVPEADAVEQAAYEAKAEADQAASEGTQHRV